MKKIFLIAMMFALGVPSIAQAQVSPEETAERLKARQVIDQRVEEFYKSKDAAEHAQRAPQQVAQAEAEGAEEEAGQGKNLQQFLEESASSDQAQGLKDEAVTDTEARSQFENYPVFFKTAFAELAYEGGNGKSSPESVSSAVLGVSVSYSLAGEPDKDKDVQDFGVEARLTGIFSSNENLSKAGIDPGVSRFSGTIGFYTRYQVKSSLWLSIALGGGAELSDREGYTNGGLVIFQFNGYLYPERGEQNALHPNEIHSAIELEALYNGVYGSEDARRDYARYRLYWSPLDQHWFSFGAQVSYMEFDVGGPDFQGWDYGGVVRFCGRDWVKEYNVCATGSISAGPNRGPNAFAGFQTSWF